MKIITHPCSGQQFKMGRCRPSAPHCRSSFKDLMAAKVLPDVTVPSTTHYSAKAPASLHNIYKNDVLGDCVIAGGYHVRGITSANGGKSVLFSDDQVIQDYSAIGGYNPKATPDQNGENPTDQGCDENVALKYWETTGFPDGVKLVNAIAIDATNIEEVRLALYLFENVYFGVELPDAWVNPMPAGPGWRWDKTGVPDQNNGHCFIGVDLVPDGVKIDSWGMCGYLTNAAISYYASPSQNGQLFTLLTPDIICNVTKKSPAGYDLTTLTTYLSQL